MAKKSTREIKEDRLAEIEAALVRRVGYEAIARTYAQKWGLQARQIKRYIAEVRKRWREEAEARGPGERIEDRAHMRKSLNDAYYRAMSKAEIMRDASGQPIMHNGKPLKSEKPDVNAAVGAAKVLIQLDGLADKTPQEVEIKATVAHSAVDVDELDNILMGLKATKKKEGE